MAGKTRRERIIDAALAVAAERPWHEVTLSQIAEHARMDLAELRREFRSRAGIVHAFLDRIDIETLSGDEGLDETADMRDRLFDLVMRRFDALGPYKSSVRSIAGSLARDPGAAIPALIRLINLQTWILDAAGGSANGLMGRLRTRGLAAAYARTFRVWIEEDDPGLPRTMATLDRALRRGERLLARAEPPVVAAEGMACLVAGLLFGGKGGSRAGHEAGGAARGA